MKIAAISDVHVKAPGDEADKLLQLFLQHPRVQESDFIVFLGDIFDLMCGPHEEYVERYGHLFSLIAKHLEEGRKVYYFEGNHDVHLQKLFRDVWKNDQILITQSPLSTEIEGKVYYFSHGDEHEVENLSYHRYMRFIRSKPLKFVAEKIMPLSVLDFIGIRASKISRKNGSRRFDAEKIRTTFREGVRKTTEGKFDFVLGGHSHVKDSYLIPGTDSLYLNNGYALNSRTFILIDNHKPEFVPLS